MRIVIAAAALALLTGCTAGSSFHNAPVGVGNGPNQLKRTPCACLERKQPDGLPDFLATSAVGQIKAYA